MANNNIHRASERTRVHIKQTTETLERAGLAKDKTHMVDIFAYMKRNGIQTIEIADGGHNIVFLNGRTMFVDEGG